MIGLLKNDDVSSIGGAEAKLACQADFTLMRDFSLGRICLNLVYKEPY